MSCYEIDVHWSDVDEAHVAHVPDLPGCMAHGPSREEARANAENAIKAWIDMAEEFGDPIPPPPVAVRDLPFCSVFPVSVNADP